MSRAIGQLLPAEVEPEEDDIEVVISVYCKSRNSSSAYKLSKFELNDCLISGEIFKRITEFMAYKVKHSNGDE